MMPDSLPVEDHLPVHDCLPNVVDAIRGGQSVILRAPPGAGKTTGVPPALIQSGCLPPGKTLLLQPRRIAARAAAHRLSKLSGHPIGTKFGYHVRFDRKFSTKTQLISMTTGILLRRLTEDPLLEGVNCVILDEFHERSLELDLALGILHRVRTTFRPELRLIVMSATLETEPISNLMPDAVTIESLGRSYDVDIRYDDTLSRESRSRDAIARQVAGIIPEALRSTDGDILVFLPGVGEIHRAADLLQTVADRHTLDLCKLYGDLSPKAQDSVLAPRKRRKIVLATNVAETSLTIPGVTGVIDSGLARVMRYDASVGIPSLQLQPISKASADQRAGRSGRTAPGVCFRLWPRAFQRSRADFTPPEVARADLSSAILMLAAWGERDVSAFPWITPPADHAVNSARDLLVQLGAIDDRLVLTARGEQMNALPLHPRLSRLMIAAQENQCVIEASLAAALLSEKDPFLRTPDRHDAIAGPPVESDLINRIVRLQSHLSGCSDPEIHRAGAENIARVALNLRRSVDRRSVDSPMSDASCSAENLSRSILAAYPDRLAKRRESESASGVMVGGRGVKLDRSTSVRTSELFVCINIDGRGEESLVRMAQAIHEEWLSDDQLRFHREIFFHQELQSVVARDRRYFLDLLLRESPSECKPDQDTTALLVQHAQERLDQVMPANDRALKSFLARWRFLTEQVQSPDLPLDVDSAIKDTLSELCLSRTSFNELRRAPWLDHLTGMFSYEQRKWLDQQAPESIEVPSGNRIRIEYPLGKPPVLAVRIQEIYGWKQTPRLAAGNVSLQLHLLGPNRRPQQITEDLESFWKTTYISIKKELKRRYSKHHWPDNPATAIATPNGLKPKTPKS